MKKKNKPRYWIIDSKKVIRPNGKVKSVFLGFDIVLTGMCDSFVEKYCKKPK
ncbi:hypothetical protein LCGC14_2095580 [marine sediment metagenome]|uniref:Uncharacterized protein n=1 Tax=marine sediment metagenome TaxID=412755 RepID=A0A0F9GPM9_9ZZZZ